ncbi:hypothetical protein [Actinomadura litoris]|uniref:hypothetical protein n=1 Tax=Actinomadura litoris TaxID=2678616 RepID=UPI001FA735E8|nr:hypothetical protein [Actinomadura litoris]
MDALTEHGDTLGYPWTLRVWVRHDELLARLHLTTIEREALLSCELPCDSPCVHVGVSATGPVRVLAAAPPSAETMQVRTVGGQVIPLTVRRLPGVPGAIGAALLDRDDPPLRLHVLDASGADHAQPLDDLRVPPAARPRRFPLRRHRGTRPFRLAG